MDTPAPASVKFAVLATDTALFTVHNDELLVRLIKVERPPHFSGVPGLPGGLIDPKETAEESSLRVLEKKGKISKNKIYSEQLYTMSEVDRDPRGRVVAVSYLALVPWNELDKNEQESGKETFWLPVHRARGLAYDHDEILKIAVKRLRSRVSYTTVIQKILPKEFTLTELEHTYQVILGSKLDKRNFRKKILKLDILKALPHKKTEGAFRPAQLYTFKTKSVDELDIL